MPFMSTSIHQLIFFALYQGFPVHFELCPPGRSGLVTPTPKREYLETEIGGSVTVELKDGTCVTCRHIGGGVVILNAHYEAIRDAFRAVWPWDYASNDINSKHPESKQHREAFDKLVSFVWPAGTEEKFMGLVGFPLRAPFHRGRLDVCLGILLSAVLSYVTVQPLFVFSKSN